MYIPTKETQLVIDGDSYRFTFYKDIAYGETGKAGTTYQLVSKHGQSYALKVFDSGFRNSRIFRNTEKIKKYKTVRGLSTADRKILTRQGYPQIASRNQELENAILMPWIQGKTWKIHVVKRASLPQKNCINIARQLSTLLCDIEEQGLSHCDVAGGNIVFNDQLSHVELIDIEEMFGPDFEPPEKDFWPAGTPGYVPNWILENGFWGPYADRYAGGIITAEILGWANPQVRTERFDESYFAPNEVGNGTNQRFTLLINHLRTINPLLSELFETTWHAKTINQCPSLRDWKLNIPQEEILPIVNIGPPPKLLVEPNFLDFGTYDPRYSRNQSQSITVTISNTGGGVINGKIHNENWVYISVSTFTIQPNSTIKIKVALNNSCPLPKTGNKGLFTKVFVIESNIGSELIGGSYSIPRKRSLWG